MVFYHVGKTKALRMVSDSPMILFIKIKLAHHNLVSKTRYTCTLTAQTKHSKHHFPPSASTARIPSLIAFLQPLHLGERSRT